ncbi:D-arabinitol 2-dehydrogenase [Colletotrichum sidae]|uniref:D-arabinitol 2-dehydrogenase n=1 Tax=Colletotrichum sidae TaxID=1347389 RepID=A0A4R8THW0_9PEZI|nr:D-arabinitol 2-dehydrogenase [Colletotrichum sidae]
MTPTPTQQPGSTTGIDRITTPFGYVNVDFCSHISMENGVAFPDLNVMKWEARLSVTSKSTLQLMQKGFHLSNAIELKEKGYIQRDCCPDVFLEVERDWKHTRFYTLSNSQDDWTAKLFVMARELSVLAKFRLWEDLPKSHAYQTVAYCKAKQRVYNFWSFRPDENFNTLCEDQCLEGLWPWPKPEDLKADESKDAAEISTIKGECDNKCGQKSEKADVECSVDAEETEKSSLAPGEALNLGSRQRRREELTQLSVRSFSFLRPFISSWGLTTINMADPSARDQLTKRQIPFMTLAKGLEGLPGAESRTASASDDAQSRFALQGSAVVTGGTGAIAQAVVRAMLQHGLKGLMLLDLDVTSVEAVKQVADLREKFPDTVIEALSVDVTDEEGVAKAMDRAVEVFGGIDHLVCFAGVVGCVHALDMPASQFRKILDINTTGAFICAQAAARVMVRQGRGGRIVFTASISAHRVNFPQPQAAYNTSKGALLMLKSSLAAEWARYGINVNSISPGYMDTVLNEGEGLAEARNIWAERNPAGRMGLPEEVAGVVIMLCSKAGSYFNGSDLVVDGGGVVF